MELYAVRIFVRDWAKACRFYGETLGLKERYRNEEVGWAEYDLGGPCLGIERVQTGDTEGEAMIGRFVGVSLRVNSVSDTYEALHKRGVAFVAPPEKQFWGSTLAHFRDPDGNVLTLLS